VAQGSGPGVARHASLSDGARSRAFLGLPALLPPPAASPRGGPRRCPVPGAAFGLEIPGGRATSLSI
jgi:hypothetical protein